ncbi:MAG: hypothetical protein QOJ15_4300 [Bradyrhizobium sp.]|jgi:hypothetical protein|nr:hypothetical protein [Bradyrhizobium sp.]
MVGKQVRHLEHPLGSLLVNRSTRRQGVTALGRNYVEHCRDVRPCDTGTSAGASGCAPCPEANLRRLIVNPRRRITTNYVVSGRPTAKSKLSGCRCRRLSAQTDAYC